jgi:hypothetical protein
MESPDCAGGGKNLQFLIYRKAATQAFLNIETLGESLPAHSSQVLTADQPLRPLH